MTGLASDLDALNKMIVEGIQELREKNPEHELMEWAEPMLGERQFTEAEWETFFARFAKEEGTTVLQSDLNYLSALDQALGRKQ